MENKININDFDKIDILKKMKPKEILDLIDRHILEQGNTAESDWTVSARKSLENENKTEKKKWQLACNSLITYAYWYGGACQNLD